MKQIGQKTLSRPTAALCTASAALLLLLFLVGLLLFSASYHEIYDSPPPAKDGVMDFSGYPVTSRKVDSLLDGEWEFYYGKWIVTDGEAGVSDGFIEVPGRWTGIETESGKLPRTGYASYRLILKNVPEDLPIFVYRLNYHTPYRVFLNGQLCVRSGTLSKSGGRASGVIDERHDFLTDGGDIEIVVELGYSLTGGLTASPWMHAGASGKLGTAMGNSALVLLGFSAGIFALSVLLTAGFYRYHRDPTLPILLGALLFTLIFSKDLTTRLFIPVSVSFVLGGIGHLLSAAALILHLYRAGMRPSKVGAAVCGGGTLLAFVLFAALFGTKYVVLPALLIPFLLLSPIYFLARSPMKAKFKGIYTALVFAFACVFAFALAEGVGLIAFGTELFFSVLLSVMILLFALVGFYRIRDITRDVLKASELERELQRVKQQALKAQIKPHFIFNSLTAIQALYHRDLKEGDDALERFARHLRLNVDADGAELIPFEDEIRNILNYFELENLRLGGTLTLLLDINYTDFEVPVLSLQPLVENAIRYGGTGKEGGYISIASGAAEGGVELVISDNGRGFDPEKVPEGVGLTNTRERFRGLLGAAMTLSSAPGQGTSIKIFIPDPQKGDLT